MTKINSKQCVKCQEVKPVGEFFKESRKKDGLKSYCKPCDRAYKDSRKGSFEVKTSKALHQSRYKAKKYGVESTLTLAEVRAILSIERCAYCHAETPQEKRTLDHVQPLTDNGVNTFENVVMACSTCNSAKHNRPAYDFIMKKAHKDATRLLLGTLAERMDVAPIQALRLLERQQTAYSEAQFYAKHYGESAQ